ncbi:DUF6294 family protein [Kibdelosporangium phytohabitans]|uniref:DUF6294 domain-containing protein n=1 Tax=Kibdelosporangium phytohabitans TaxID=860235 RepID=A0A0N9I7E2_9PSEU|nr:DUF6294 family protein [Kibdelosporangium phytohabitans]ALG12060.1 hypothetical protein AOZ06_38960 [Kibdelosporangium phytohabitans]MBE1463542.1 hypothetical protein [Kibdelosporangium phytohabitans]
MTFKARWMSIVVAMLALALGSIFATPASAQTQTSAAAQALCNGYEYCWFTWGPIRAGDCTMEEAKWTLYRDGRAYFEARIISSDSNDAWLMWPEALDTSGIVLGAIHHGGDPKFVRGTVKNEWRWWFDSGSFDARFFDRVDSMRLKSHC